MKIVKVLLVLVFALSASGVAANQEIVKPGILPDSHFYFLERASESVKTFFVFDKDKKAERWLKLANERAAEAEALFQNGKVELAETTFANYNKRVDQTLENAKKNPEFLKRIIQNLSAKKQKFIDLIKNSTGETQVVAKEKFEPKIRELDDKIKQIIKEFKDDTTVELAEQPKKTKPEAALAPQFSEEGGKPNMNEDGSTQVTRPKGLSSCNSKLYLCKIHCGEDIIDNCNGEQAPALYDLLNCRGECTKYNVLYGCGMEAGCDAPCWDEYNSKCSMSVYQSCVNDCETQFE
jgi:hypothetical protein